VVWTKPPVVQGVRATLPNQRVDDLRQHDSVDASEARSRLIVI
jgi:hypothetical protein